MFSDNKQLVQNNKIDLEYIKNPDGMLYDFGLICTYNINIKHTKDFVDHINGNINENSWTMLTISILYDMNAIFLERYIHEVFLIENNLYLKFIMMRDDILYDSDIRNKIINHGIVDWFMYDPVTAHRVSHKKFVE